MLSESSLKLLKHLPALCNMTRRVAVQAGEITLEHFDEAGLDESRYDIKLDGSPLTKADTEAEAYIIKELRIMLPDVPVIAEESIARGEATSLEGHDYFWLVDPLDGTMQFKKGSNEYTVNIALIHHGVPVIGVIFAPARGELYAACGPGTAIRWLAENEKDKSIKVRRAPHEGLTVLSSKNYGDPKKLDSFLRNHKVAKCIGLGSSLKLCSIAAGKADLYPRFGETSEWDTAAGDAILRAAGGLIEDMNGQPLVYGKAAEKFINPEFVARAADLAL